LLIQPTWLNLWSASAVFESLESGKNPIQYQNIIETKNYSMNQFHFRIRDFTFLFCLFLLSACGSQNPTAIPPTTSQTESGTSTPFTMKEGDQGILDVTNLDFVPTLADIAPTRTPVPTSTPDALTQEIIDIIQETGLSGKTLLWLGYADWINLGISLLYVLAGYLIGTWLIRWLLPRLVRRTKTKLDDQLLKISGDELRWLAVVLIFYFAVNRLNFVHANAKRLLTDISFFLALFLIVQLFWRLINLAAQQAHSRASAAGHQKEAESLITLAVWGLRLVLIAFVVAFILTYFGVNITGFAFILGAIILVISLAGRDILADIVSGAMILIDRPYRIGDRLDLPFINSWGDVVDIGMRSTKILSVENRMVVVPNSQIGKNQVVNYSYPDPAYFNTIKVLVAYDNDPDLVAKVIEDAVRSVEGVQTDREVSTWLMEFTENHMLFWSNWWVANFTDRFPVQNQVSRAIIKALKEAGVALPYQSLDIQMDETFLKSEPPQENPKE